MFFISLFKNETHSLEDLSQSEVRHLNRHKTPYRVIYLLLCIGCVVLGWYGFTQPRDGVTQEWVYYVLLFGPWVFMHLYVGAYLAPKYREAYQLKCNRIIHEKGGKNTAANERIDNLEFSVSEEVLKAINYKRTAHKQVLVAYWMLVTLFGLALLLNFPDFVARLLIIVASLFLIVIMFNGRAYSYRKDIKALAAAPLIKSIPGIKADNLVCSDSDSELFRISSIAKNDFGLNTKNMTRQNQFCVDEENRRTNSCVIHRVESDGTEHGTQTDYNYRMLQLTNSSLKSDGTILIKRKKTHANPARGSGLTEVKLLSPDFVKLFEVYADDQVGARKFLTPAFMEHFMATVGVDFRALHVKSGAITALYNDEDTESDGGSFFGSGMPSLFDKGDVKAERLVNEFKKGVAVALSEHYERVASLQELLKIKDIDHKG